jgi:hypothetical protein
MESERHEVTPKAYRLSGTRPFAVELGVMPRLGVVEENYATYFLATNKGIDLVKGRLRHKA